MRPQVLEHFCKIVSEESLANETMLVNSGVTSEDAAITKNLNLLFATKSFIMHFSNRFQCLSVNIDIRQL